MRAVVTGAAGFIGSHLCEHLLESGDEVVGIDCFSDSYDPCRKESNAARLTEWARFRLVQADLAESVDAALVRNADVVFHLAGESGTRPSWGVRFPAYAERNIVGTWRLLDAARQAHLRKFVHASCASVYGDASGRRTPESAELRPVSPYGASKVATEGLCEAYRRTWRVPVASLRLFTVGVVNIGTGSSVSLLELIRMVSDLIRPVDVVRLPEQPGAVRHCTADIALERAWFGYTPHSSLVDGLAELVMHHSSDDGTPWPQGVAAFPHVDDSPGQART